jgi:hypothetical protein
MPRAHVYVRVVTKTTSVCKRERLERLIADSREQMACFILRAPLDVAIRMCERERRELLEASWRLRVRDERPRQWQRDDRVWLHYENGEQIEGNPLIDRARHIVTQVTQTPETLRAHHLHSLEELRFQTMWKSRDYVRNGTQPAVGRARCRDDNRRPGCRQVASRPLYARGGNERRAAD